MNHRIDHQGNRLSIPMKSSISYNFITQFETTYYQIKILFHMNFQFVYKANTFLIVLIDWHLINK